MNSLNPILLVEDSLQDIELRVAALEEIQVANRVIVLHDGAEALTFLRETLQESEGRALPAVILLDIKMPKVSGIDVLKFLKADPQLKELPIVMLTSSREGADIDRCYRLGVNAYVVRPVDFPPFFQAVKDVGRFWAIVNQPGSTLALRRTAGTNSRCGPGE